MAKNRKEKVAAAPKATGRTTGTQTKKCEFCGHCRFVVVLNDGNYSGGLCELGPKLRGSTGLPAEQTCDSWEAKK